MARYDRNINLELLSYLPPEPNRVKLRNVSRDMRLSPKTLIRRIKLLEKLGYVVGFDDINKTLWLDKSTSEMAMIDAEIYLDALEQAETHPEYGLSPEDLIDAV